MMSDKPLLHIIHSRIVSVLKGKRYDHSIDIGCLDGHLVNELRKDNIVQVCDAIDIKKSDQLIDEDIMFIQADMNKEYISTKQYDLVTCTEVIEHVENQFQLIRNISLMTRTGGTVIISSPNIYNLQSKILFTFSGQVLEYMTRDYPEHINPLYLAPLLRFAEDNRLRLVKKHYCSFHVPLTKTYLGIVSKHLSHTIILELEKTG